ncbi:hypothetical protein GCM10027047_28810 [Rhodococcus aerolatus]
MRNESPGEPVPRAEWSVVAHRRGVPWWGAVALAVVLTAVGAGIDLLIGDTLTTVFQVFYGLGCLAAVLAVAQRGLFAAMVQPPLVLAVAVPTVVLLLGGPGDSSTRGKVIATAIPLVNGFPTMAVATLLTIAIGVVRIRTRRAARPAHTSRSARPAAARPAGGGAAPRRAGARRAGSGRPAAATPARSAAPQDDDRSPWQREGRAPSRPEAPRPRDPQARDPRSRDPQVPDPRPRRERPAEASRTPWPAEPVTNRPARTPRPAPPRAEEPRYRRAREDDPRDRLPERPPQSRWQEPGRAGSPEPRRGEPRRSGHRYR